MIGFFQRCWPVLFALFSGALLSLCYPRWNVEWLIWFWMAPLLVALWYGVDKKRAQRQSFCLGYFSGLVFFLINLYWISLIEDAGWLAFLGWIVLSLYLALYFGGWALCVSLSVGFNEKKLCPQKSPHDRLINSVSSSFYVVKVAVLYGAAWVAFEWLRGWLFTGFGWNGLGVALHKNLVLIQICDVIGVTGLSFVPVFITTVFLLTIRRLYLEKKFFLPRPHLDFMGAILLLIGLFLYGISSLNFARKGEDISLRVLIVQPNIPQSEKWDPQYIDEICQTFTAFTLPYLKDDTLDLVVWPESALPFSLHTRRSRQFYEDLLSQGNVHLISGTTEEVLNEGVYNSLVFFDKGGGAFTTYRKIHLVPFGEYLPFRNQFPIFRWITGNTVAGDFSKGKSTVPLEMSSPQVHLIPMICFEDTLGRLTRQFVREEKPQLMVNATNDAWFQKSAASEQHLANAVFRCVELRRPMLRAANTGVSCILDPVGKIIARVEDPWTGDTFIAGTLPATVEIPKKGSLTFYARYGDIFSFILMAIFLFSMTKRKRRGRDK